MHAAGGSLSNDCDEPAPDSLDMHPTSRWIGAALLWPLLIAPAVPWHRSKFVRGFRAPPAIKHDRVRTDVRLEFQPTIEKCVTRNGAWHRMLVSVGQASQKARGNRICVAAVTDTSDRSTSLIVFATQMAHFSDGSGPDGHMPGAIDCYTELLREYQSADLNLMLNIRRSALPMTAVQPSGNIGNVHALKSSQF